MTSRPFRLVAVVAAAALLLGGWLGSGEDSAGSCAGGFAEQQLALSMARQGGFGLADLISKGLQRSR